MKKVKGFFELIFAVVLLVFIFGSFSGEKPRKRSKKKLVGIFLILFGLGWLGYNVWDHYNPVQDCVPATLQRVFPQYDQGKMRQICYTQREGTLIADFFFAWEELSTNKLEVVYSASSIPADGNLEFDLDKNYLWLGMLRQGGHCALIQFRTNGVVISNSQLIPGTTNYFLLKAPSDTKFFASTWFILDAPELKNVRFE